MRIRNLVAPTLQFQTQSTVTGNLRRRLSPPGVDFAAYGSALQHCSDHRLLRQGKQLHARLILLSVTPDNFLASKLILFYSKSNHAHFARKVFDTTPHRNTFTWNAMLLGYSFNSMFRHALNLFGSFTFSTTPNASPDNFTISCVLKALASSFCSPELAKEVHCLILRRGLYSDIFVLNALITCYCRCDEVWLARHVFDGMSERDIVTWNAMIGGYSQRRLYDECKRLYLEMLNVSAVAPNVVTAVSVMQACGQSMDLAFGMELHRFVKESGIEIDVSLSNAVVAMYAKCGRLDYAREMFEGMREKDEVTYGAIISGYMDYGLVDDAMGVFRGVKNPGLNMWNAVISGMVQNKQFEGVFDLVRQMQGSGLSPNAVTLASILPSFSYFSNLRGGKEVHGYAIRRGYEQNVYVSTSIIDAYGKLGCICGARWVFDLSQSRSLIIWTSIISAYAAHGDAGLALGLYAQMLDKGIRPDPVTLTSVLTACAHSGLVDEAWNIFNSMPSKYGIQPLVEHYACMVGVLSRAGKLSEAVQFISEMPIEPSAKVWGPLLHGASVFGDVEIGKFACDHLFEIEPENTGNYIIMANLYAHAGKWEQAGEVRERMKVIGLQKIRGSSWIETSGGLLSFIAKDVSNGRSDEIYALLEGLLGLMREEGCVLQEELDYENVFS
ncbi:pentatricopeptide repeat-containing protein At2g37310 [Glycine soja]|uniref:Pentatricopeptide repeat-containing protein n=1 Tax=Glycine soja TaxID=3848 RepID=A0A445HFL5_GLYSO|nr:pentatricopeptide repeat-containing protein At2g37310 [Glycine soja]RZB72379.1 Pentatricopeptide repeat-containing protein [Glycine soja]